MTPPPDPHKNDARGDIYGQLLQAHDIHGGVTVNASPEPAAAADVSLDPPRLANVVRGRVDLLAVLQGAMVRGAPMPHVLTGAGGFGKTTVAAALAEYARREGWTVFWVRPDAIVPSMLEAAIELGGARTEAEEVRNAPRQAARWAWRHLDSAPEPWLLVIDNADRPEDLDPQNRPGEQRGWVRSSPGGFVLVTTRVDDPALWAPATAAVADCSTLLLWKTPTPGRSIVSWRLQKEVARVGTLAVNAVRFRAGDTRTDREKPQGDQSCASARGCGGLRPGISPGDGRCQGTSGLHPGQRVPRRLVVGGCVLPGP